MDRINGANTVDIGGGRRGFRDRNLGAGLAGTQVTAAHMNALQEEVMGVIEEAGIVPADGDWTQLLDALKALFGGDGTVATDGYMRLPGGLIVQWGRVAVATRTLSASAAVTFPLEFPTACFVVIPSIWYSDPGLLDMHAGTGTPSTTGVTLMAGQTLGAEGSISRDFGWHWVALGH